MRCLSTSNRALSGDAGRPRPARHALRWLGCLACCLVASLTSSARALPRFPSVETIPVPTNLPDVVALGIQPSPRGLRLADLDGDGDLDMVATLMVFTYGYLVTWFNQGDGTFSLGETVWYSPYIMEAIETADLDLDGDIDVVLSTGEYASVYLNDGSGKLAKFGFGYHLTDVGGVSVTVADVDRDHFPDLVSVSVDITEPGELRVYLSHHDGSFGLPPKNGSAAVPNVVMPMPDFTQSYAAVVARDLNADGFADLVIDDARRERLLYFKGNGVASWNSEPTILAAGYFPVSALASDIDLDGDPDLLAVDRVFGELVVLENDGGEFSAPVPGPSLLSSSLDMADLNNDCFPDAISASGYAGYVGVMLNRGDGSFADPINYSFASLLNAIQAGDIDGDGDLDLVTAGGATPEGVTQKPGYLSIARNLGAGEFWAPKAYDVAQSYGLASGDFDADGRADFALGENVFMGSAAGGYEAWPLDTTSQVKCSGCGAAVVDLNADGWSDVLQYGGRSAVFVSNGNGTFSKASTVTTSDTPVYVSLGHLNKDTLWDFVDQQGSAYNVEFFGATSTSFTAGPIISWNFPNLIGITLPKLADLNGDGADELLVPNLGSNGLGVGINNGDGTSFTKKNYALGATPKSIDVADYTGDGKLDAVVSVDSGALLVYPGKGDGSLLASKTYPMTALPGPLASADFDGDGDLDLVVSTQDYSNTMLYVENVGKGVFSKTADLFDAVGPGMVVAADLEGDGDADFAVVNPVAGTLTTFENRQLTEDPAKSQPLVCDVCPNDKDKTVPGVCGCGVPDADTDDDGVVDCKDACPKDASKQKAGVCGCGVSDRDTDRDGKADCLDDCPQDPRKTVAGVCGCGAVDADSDRDGTADCHDACPSDIAKIAPGTCGCGVADGDSDGDLTVDCVDACPDDPTKVSPGLCGCGARDDDADQDGKADCSDGCPLDPLKQRAGACGCGIADTDTDGDGWPDCVDECPSTPYTCASSGGESAGGSAGAGSDGPGNGGGGGTAGAGSNESEAAGAGLGGGSEPSMGGGNDDDTPLDAAGSANDSGGAPEQMLTRPTGTQILPQQHASGCDCSTASSSGASPLALWPLSLLLLCQRRRRAKPANLIRPACSCGSAEPSLMSRCRMRGISRTNASIN